jgi:hypothetical protein
MSAENGAIAAWSHDLESPMAGARTYMSRSHASRRATGGQAATTRPDHRRSAAATLAARLAPKPARSDAQASAPADIAARRRTSIDIEAATMRPSTETRQEPRPPTLAGQRRQRPLVIVRRNGGDERHRQHGQRGDAAHHRCDRTYEALGRLAGWGGQPPAGQISGDGRGRGPHPVPVLKVPHDGVRARVQALALEILAELDNPLDRGLAQRPR